jgi:organic radical activating enzyme
MSITQIALDVLETGYTVQGEGIHMGVPMTLIRVRNCNLHCDFCDTKEKMDKKGVPFRFSDYIEFIDNQPKNSIIPTTNVMLTGGEPMMYPTELMAFITQWSMYSRRDSICNVETNGLNLFQLYMFLESNLRRYPSHVYTISCSPKTFAQQEYKNLANAMQLIKYNADPEYVHRILTFKHVVSSEMAETVTRTVCMIQSALPELPTINNIVMPMGTTVNEINDAMPHCMALVRTHGCRMSSRLHIVHNDTIAL